MAGLHIRRFNTKRAILILTLAVTVYTLLLVLIIELVLRGVNHVLRIRILVVLDLRLSKRIGSVPRNPDRLINRGLSKVRIGIDPAHPSLLLGVDRCRWML